MTSSESFSSATRTQLGRGFLSENSWVRKLPGTGWKQEREKVKEEDFGRLVTGLKQLPALSHWTRSA